MARIALVVLAFLGYIGSVSAAEPVILTVDLSTGEDESIVRTIKPNTTYRVKLRNVLPRQETRYSVRVENVDTHVAPLSFPGSDSQSAKALGGAGCPELTAQVDAMRFAETEESVGIARRRIEHALPQCADAAVKSAARSILALTELDPGNESYEVGAEGELRVVVVRGEREWRTTFRTPRSRNWFLSYGFTFAQNDDRKFYLASSGDAATPFRVDRMVNDDRLDFAPAVLFTWKPEWTDWDELALGLTAGLDADVTDPQLFLGPSVLFNRNVALVGGATMHKVARLAGEYRENQLLTSTVAEDKLHDRVYRLGYFFGLSFRFDKSPFAKTEPKSATLKGDDPKEDRTPSPTPTPTPTPAPEESAGPSNEESERPAFSLFRDETAKASTSRNEHQTRIQATKASGLPEHARFMAALRAEKEHLEVLRERTPREGARDELNAKIRGVTDTLRKVDLQSQHIAASSVWRVGAWPPGPTIPVCWEEWTAGEERERAWVRDAVANTWESAAAVSFIGWGRCETRAQGIRIGLIRGGDRAPHTANKGRLIDGMQNGMMLRFSFKGWSPECEDEREFCIRTIGVHEFGHVLGFAHEDHRKDAPSFCQREAHQGAPGDWQITIYDPDSVMNYCNPRWLNYGRLSSLDEEGVQRLYGCRKTVPCPGTIAER